MDITKITYWQDGKYWIGYLNDYPECVTEGLSYEELIDNLQDIYDELIERCEKFKKSI